MLDYLANESGRMALKEDLPFKPQKHIPIYNVTSDM